MLALAVAGCSDDDDAAEVADPPSTESTTTAVDVPSSTEVPETTTTEPVAETEPVTVTGPVTSAPPQANAALQDLAAAGYIEEEYIFEGTADSYDLVGTGTGNDWAVEVLDSADFRTRMIVRRPADASGFSGTVVVEWLNVSAGADGDPDWGYLHREILREGHAYAGVSVQAVGVIGGEALLGDGGAAGGLAGTNPERYGTLTHPGDAYSFDIYSHAVGALLNPAGADPLGELEPQQVIGVGESQSAIFMTTYINAVHSVARAFDGFLVHSRGSAGPPLTGERISGSIAEPVPFRTDLAEPVFIYTTETDLTVLGYAAARQDDTDTIRGWEVAGTAHADRFLLEEVYGLADTGDLAALLSCTAPLNAGPHSEVLQAGFHHLVEWAAGGDPPPSSPRLEMDGDAIARDERGNALGGIRTPLVDAPVATLSGDPVPGAGGFCFLFGFTTPFDDATIAELYPTRDDYETALSASADVTVAAGFLLQVDADELVADALAEWDAA